MHKLLYSLSLLSCEKEQTADTGLLNAKSSEFSQENCEFGPYGLYFDNGVSSDCVNNMLHFPSWESYFETIDMLEIQLDNHEDAFVNANSNLSDDVLTDLEDATGFDALLPLKVYENSHEFCSLRALVDTQIAAFMASLPSGVNNMSQNPDDNQFVDELDRVLYNQQSEIMVCGFIFKWMEDGLLQLDANNPLASEVLSFANNETSSAEDVVNTFNPGAEAPWVLNFTSPGNDGSCFYDSKEIEYEYSNNNQRRVRKYNRLITIGEGGTATGTLRFASQSVFKSITKNERYKNGWKGLRIRSHARIVGEIHNSNLGCPEYVPRDQRSTIKKRRTRREKLRVPRQPNVPAVGTGIDKLRSTHLQGTVEYELYFQ